MDDATLNEVQNNENQISSGIELEPDSTADLTGETAKQDTSVTETQDDAHDDDEVLLEKKSSERRDTITQNDQGTSPLPNKEEGQDDTERTEEEKEAEAEQNVNFKVDVKVGQNGQNKRQEIGGNYGSTSNIPDTRLAKPEDAISSPKDGDAEESTQVSSGAQFDPGVLPESPSDLVSRDGLKSEDVWCTLNVKVETDEGEKEVKLHVIKENFRKPFLGGFKHRLTGVEYLNASSQTYPKRRIPPSIEKFHRDTQTVASKNQFQQTANETSTQMTKVGCYVSNVTDKVITPGKYETADEYHARRLEKVIILQSYWRRWLAKRLVNKLRTDREKRIEWERQEAIRKQKEREERIRLEFERRMNPKTKEDFDLLYAALEKWRLEEIQKINETRSGPERKAALVGLLEQESYLIGSIERHRIKANKTNKDEHVNKFLDKAASSKKWRNDKGEILEMDTPHTLRAQQLRDLYNSLQMKYLTQEERLDILLTLKHTVQEHDCKLTQEIVELIDRETDLMMRGVKGKNLEGLRQRISTLFIQYCKTPLFNPEAARLLKVPQDASTLRKNIYFCPSCSSYLPSTEFPLASNSRVVGRCKRCAKLDNDARLRQDFSKFRVMLRNLRRTEEEFNDGSKIAFIIQEADLRYLVENIWNGQSVLSAMEDLHELVVIRWNKHEQWSPWNCILLSKDEADAHFKLENVNEAYGRIFIGKVHHRHVLAQNYFAKLESVAQSMQSKEANASKPTALTMRT